MGLQGYIRVIKAQKHWARTVHGRGTGSELQKQLAWVRSLAIFKISPLHWRLYTM